MKIAILSDIHGNFDALSSVVPYLEVDEIVVLGDMIGYGAQPEECVQWVVCHRGKAVLGNHEAAFLGVFPLSWFNPQAAQALLWTKERLSISSVAFLRSLPQQFGHHGAFWVHGSLRDPVGEYVYDLTTAKTIFEQFSFSLCFFGHTHLAEAYVYSEYGEVKRISFLAGGRLDFSSSCRYLINCGSVGQPRDGNPQASFGLYDTQGQCLEIKRIDYPVEKAAEKILHVGLPEYLAYRLLFGQ